MKPALLLVPLLAGCVTELPIVDHISPPAVFPALRELPLRLGWEDQIREIPHLVVDDQGSIIYSINTPGEDRLIRLDTTGKRVATWAPTGSGPGEFEELAIPFLASDTILVFNTAKLRFARFLRDGSFLDESPEVLPRIPLQIEQDSVDEFATGRDGLTTSGIIQRRSLHTTRGRTLLGSGDSLLRQTLGPAGKRVPVWAVRGPLSVLADPVNYRLYFLQSNGRLRWITGRDLPPNHRGPRELALRLQELDFAARPETLADGSVRPARDLSRERASAAIDTLPHFVHPGMQFDGTGRLWIIGTQGDTTFADAFADSLFLGREILPCTRPSSVSVRGQWLALTCQPPTPGKPYGFHLFHLEEPGSLAPTRSELSSEK